MTNEPSKFITTSGKAYAYSDVQRMLETYEKHGYIQPDDRVLFTLTTSVEFVARALIVCAPERFHEDICASRILKVRCDCNLSRLAQWLQDEFKEDQS